MMNSFWAKLRLIPRPAWITGCLLPVVLVLPLVLGPMQYDREMHAWPLVAKVGLISIVPVFIVVYSALVGFIYADAKRRRMRHHLDFHRPRTTRRPVIVRGHRRQDEWPGARWTRPA
jgi:hypothetical protein